MDATQNTTNATNSSRRDLRNHKWRGKDPFDEVIGTYEGERPDDRFNAKVLNKASITTFTSFFISQGDGSFGQEDLEALMKSEAIMFSYSDKS